MKKVLAIDMGATSIRALLAGIENDKLVVDEVMRLSHKIVDDHGRKRWQFDLIMKKISETILKYKDQISSIAVDTWGVDFGLLKDNKLYENPISYRDPKNSQGLSIAKERCNLYEIFEVTGNQIMPINTLFQLLAYKEINGKKLETVDHILLIPDLINYYLTGVIKTERTMASTTQMLNLNNQEWNKNLVEKLGLNFELLTDLNDHGVIGNTKNSLINSLKSTNINVVSVASHDTASAVMMTEAFKNENTMFLSSGTWTLFGVLTDKPIINKKVYEKNLTNEIGYDNKNMFFKNVTGLYVFEKLKEQLENLNNKIYSFDEINEVCEISNYVPTFDIEDERFASDDVDIVRLLDQYMKETNQEIPKDKRIYFKSVYQSIVLNLKKVKLDIEELTNKKYNRIHIIGGGSNSQVLCNLISKILKVEVISGPAEATGLGNIYVQMQNVYELSSNQLDDIFENYIEKKKY